MPEICALYDQSAALEPLFTMDCVGELWALVEELLRHSAEEFGESPLP